MLKKLNKKIVVFIAVFLAVAGTATAYLLLMPTPSATPSSNSPAASTERAPEPSPDAPAKQETASHTPARYVDYSTDAFQADTGTRVLFFHADWCPKCRALDADIAAHLGTLSDVTIYKVNYDTATDLRKQYGVTLQTTLVKTDTAGNKQASYVAYDSPSLASVKEHLAL